MFKKNFKRIIAMALTVIMMMGMSTSVFAVEGETPSKQINLSLLDTESAASRMSFSTMSGTKPETRRERHERLISEGYVLEELKVVESPTTTDVSPYVIIGDHETRAVMSNYKQPIKAYNKHASAVLNVFDSLDYYIMTAVGFVPYVGWIPSLLDISVSNITSFISNGKVQFGQTSTLFFYDIDVRPVGTTRYYSAASSEKYEQMITLTTLGYEANGSPINGTQEGFFIDASPNYGAYSNLSLIAIDYFTTGGPHGISVYFEDYPIRDEYLLS